MKHSFEEKLLMVSKVKSGYPLRRVCAEMRVDHHMLSNWILRYDKYGDAGLCQLPGSRRYAIEEKEHITREYLEKGVSLQQICLKYDVSRSTVKNWLRNLRNGDSFRNVRQRGRPPKEPMARPKKKTPQTELEILQAENLRLKAENALLKKVRALVEEQQARARLNGQKPSTN